MEVLVTCTPLKVNKGTQCHQKSAPGKKTNFVKFYHAPQVVLGVYTMAMLNGLPKHSPSSVCMSMSLYDFYHRL